MWKELFERLSTGMEGLDETNEELRFQ